MEGRENPWTDLFSPQRKIRPSGLLEYLKENIDYPYYLVRDRFAPPELRTLAAVKPGEGRLVGVNGTRVAAYRSEQGKLTLLSPTCPHLSCLVHWNGAERTWDCPCHGSRFAATGAVLSGPAESPLSDATE